MKRRFSCFLANLGWYLVPLTGFRDWLIQAHLGHCSQCQEELISQDEVLKFLAPEECTLPAELMARAERALRQEDTENRKVKRGTSRGWFSWLYAGLSALTITVLMAGFAWHLARPGELAKEAWWNDTNKTKLVSRVSIRYARAMGQPAATYVFQTEDPLMVIIWVEAVN